MYPECAKKTLVPGRLVQKISMPQCDFILLDSLVGEDGDKKVHVGGALDAAQAEWLEAELAKGSRPTIVCSHHECKELRLNSGKTLAEVLPYMPHVRGYINGHIHRWYTEWRRRFDGDPRFMRVLSLPATGNWGDLGYSLMRFTPEKTAEVRLRQDDYCYPKPVDAAKRPRSWDLAVADNRGQMCTFDLS